MNLTGVFPVYRAECLYWLDRFGLSDWEPVFRLEVLDDAIAMATTYSLSRKVFFSLATEVEDAEACGTAIEVACAFHEVCHVLLRPIIQMIEIEEAEHACINRLKGAFFENRVHSAENLSGSPANQGHIPEAERVTGLQGAE